MTINRFNYVAPKTIIEALSILNKETPNATIMSGGTDLLLKIRQGGKTPKIIIGLKKIKELNYISFEPKTGLTIGATTLLSSISKHKKIIKKYPTIAKAASLTATSQIRNMGTVVGNICNASPSADNAPILLAMNAIVNISNYKKTKKIPLEQFFISPGKTILNKNELVTSIFIPIPPQNYGTEYINISQKGNIGCTTVGVACMLEINNKVYTNVKIFIGACGPTPIRASKSEKILLNQKVDNDKIIKKASIKTSEEISPISDVRASSEYRTKIVTTITERTLNSAKKMALKTMQ